MKDLNPKASEYKSDDKFSMQKEACNRLSGERLNEIKEISEKIDYNNLGYYFKDKRIPSIDFIKFRNAFGLIEKKKNGDISFKKAEKDQEGFKKELGEVTMENPMHKEKYNKKYNRYNKKC